MIDPVAAANLFSVVQRLGRVPIGNDVDMRRRKDLQRGLERSTDDGGRSVAGDQERGVRGMWSNPTLMEELWSRESVLECDQEGRIGIAIVVRLSVIWLIESHFFRI